MDFEQLAFIEKWRGRAVRGAIVALDATRGHVLLTLRAGDLGATLDLSGRDESGAIRKQRLTLFDRAFVAFRYHASDVVPGSGAQTSPAVRKGVEVEGTLRATGELHEVDVDGTTILVESGELAAFSAGDRVRFRIADDGRAYVIPTR